MWDKGNAAIPKRSDEVMEWGIAVRIFGGFVRLRKRCFYGDKGEKKGKKRNGKESQKDLAGERNPQPGKFA